MIKLLPLLLKEDIYGENAIVYHRTRIKDLANKVYDNGFKPGERHGGSDYGIGFYATYTLKPQLNWYMRDTYGDIIVKFSCPTTNFFFCDWEEFKKTSLSKKLKATKDDFIFKQLDYYKVKYDKDFIKSKIDKDDTSKDATSQFTALALPRMSGFKQSVRGIVFTDSETGQTLVSYDTKRPIPLSYSEDEGKTWIKVDMKLDYIKKALISKLDPVKKHNKNSIEYKLIEYDIHHYTINKDGTVDVDGNVDFGGRKLKKLPIKFSTVTGDFSCINTGLTSLEGSPKKVMGTYSVFNNNLTSLRGGPKYVGKNFNINMNKLVSLKYSPEYVGGHYVYANNPKLKDTSGITKNIGGNIVAHFND